LNPQDSHDLANAPITYPLTVIVVHPRENRSKCTVEPLRGRTDFILWNYPQRGTQLLDGYVRLGIGGAPLSSHDTHRGLLVLDGTWKLAASMERDFAELPIRSLGPWETAYPRTSKLYEDPAAGLATIEAVFAAFHEMGRPTEGLLDQYHWKDEFIRRNERLLESS
jgi:pre-rRNA-processing protein TSR3